MSKVEATVFVGRDLGGVEPKTVTVRLTARDVAIVECISEYKEHTTSDTLRLLYREGTMRLIEMGVLEQEKVREIEHKHRLENEEYIQALDFDGGNAKEE